MEFSQTSIFKMITNLEPTINKTQLYKIVDKLFLATSEF